MEYKLVCYGEVTSLEEKVNDLIKQGWQLHGPSFSGVDEGHLYLFQAMVKPTSKKSLSGEERAEEVAKLFRDL